MGAGSSPPLSILFGHERSPNLKSMVPLFRNPITMARQNPDLFFGVHASYKNRQ
jgi:hypothetical protein